MAKAETTTTSAISRARHAAGLALEVVTEADGDRDLRRAARALVEYAVKALQGQLEAPGGALDVEAEALDEDGGISQ